MADDDPYLLAEEERERLLERLRAKLDLDNDPEFDRSYVGGLLPHLVRAACAEADNENGRRYLLTIFGFMDQLRNATSPWDPHRCHWSPASNPSDQLAQRKAKLPWFSRPDLEGAVDIYLGGKLRARAVDRALCHLLIASEYYGFGERMIRSPGIPLLFNVSPLKAPNPIVVLVASSVLTAVVLGVMFLVPWGAEAAGWIPGGWLEVSGGLLFGLWMLLSGLSALRLPWAFIRRHKERKRVLTLLDAMEGAYQAMRGSGPISPRHIRRIVDQAADSGVVWPAALFPLLDDVERRGATL